MKQRLKTLERLARTLDPPAQERLALLERVARHCEEFLENLDGMPAYLAPDDSSGKISDFPISEAPADPETVLHLLREHVDRWGANVPSGGHMGYIPGGGLYASALGDFLAAVSNRYAGVYFGGPGAVRMEHMLLRWLADEIGFPETASGDLTSGGSIANLIGIVSAREAHGIRVAEIPDTVVYLSEQSHHSVEKALRTAGLGECIHRRVGLDSRYRMDTDDLGRLVHEDEQAGLRPWLVISTAGTTSTGAVDPMDEIAEIASEHGLWHHVDGAYGAPFVLCQEGRAVLRGMERSDSLVLDPHKGFFLPFGSGVALVRDRQALLRAHAYEATYMRDIAPPASPEEISPADLSPEMSKHFRGLRLWLPLKLFGVAPFRAALEEKMMLARYFHQEIQKIGGFEVGPYPELSLVTFRYVPSRGDANEFNERLVRSLLEDGRVFLTSTKIGGKVILRAAILGLRTHLDTVDMALEALREKSAALPGLPG